MKAPSLWKLASLFSALGLLALTPAKAEVLFTDTFDSSLANWYFWNNSGGGTAWSRGDYGTTYPPLSGGVLRNPTGSASNTRAFRQWTADTVTLANTGDYMQLDLDFRSNATGSALNISLFNTATTISANSFGGAYPTSDADGYNFIQNWTASTAGVYRLVDNVTTLISPGFDSDSINDNTGHSLSLRLTRIDTGIQLDTTLDSIALSSKIDTSPTSYTYNSLYLNTGAFATFDNVSISTGSIPESESSAMLFGGAILALALIGRSYHNRKRVQ